MESDAKNVVARYYAEAWNTGLVDRFDDFFAADFVDHNGFPDQRPGVDEVKRAYVAFRAAFPDLHLRSTVDDMIAEGDKVIVRTTLRATHRGTFRGTPATGNPIEVEGISIFRVAGGKLVERRGLTDGLGLLRQLGAEVR
ncbi:MAG: ester cyclase [Chloroflexota bacterium]|nr:ester cyclase [Chloroflexota bacterium]